ncbi:hypothetical protein EYZ11_009773 [Aspergillus tanneri]|uniref:Uncharacterized protein n=1 Tax=Aspergillus tanneri TaxID=1220188 RepID=A0A4S3J730_9EURO|nr:hypothetical protein EYZ11_009773 [Aspergillus tanneri]
MTRLALDLGLPICGIIAFAGTASDKAGRSVPAPGQGMLVHARQIPGSMPSPLLSLDNRRKRPLFRKRQIAESYRVALEELELELEGQQLPPRYREKGSN